MDRTLNDVLTMLYAAPASPAAWPRALVGVTDLLGLSASAIVRTDLTCKANSVYLSHGVDPEVERLYATGYGNQDVYRPRFLRMQGRQGELLMGDELCTVDEMKTTAFYQDILLKADIRLWCAVATVHGEGIIENISFYHRWKDEAPGADYLKLAQAITPHLNNALRIRARLAHLEGLARDLYAALDQADTGIVLLDEHGCCAFVNRAGRQLLDQQDGLLFSKNRLLASHPQECSVLEELVRRAVAGIKRKKDIGGGTLRITRQHGRSLHIRIAPISQRTLPGWVPVRGHRAYRRPGASAETSVRDDAVGLRTDSCRSQTRAVITRRKKHLRSRTRKRSHKRYCAVPSEVHISQDRHSTPGRVDRTFGLHTRRRSLKFVRIPDQRMIDNAVRLWQCRERPCPGEQCASFAHFDLVSFPSKPLLSNLVLLIG